MQFESRTMDCNLSAIIYHIFYCNTSTKSSENGSIKEYQKKKWRFYHDQRNIGRVCKISTGSMGTNVAGKIIDINENWIEVETKKGNELINAEFVQSIKIAE